jgi:hypothetical protein
LVFKRDRNSVGDRKIRGTTGSQPRYPHYVGTAFDTDRGKPDLCYRIQEAAIEQAVGDRAIKGLLLLSARCAGSEPKGAVHDGRTAL